MTTIRLSISMDKELIIKLQAVLQAKEKKLFSIAEIVRLGLDELAKTNNVRI